MATLADRFADAARSLGGAALALPRGALRTAGRAAGGMAAAGGLARRSPAAAAGVLAVALARLALQLPADALLLLAARLASALQTLLGAEPPGRPLDGRELELLRRVYGAGVDPGPVRVKTGRLGILGIAGRAFVVADTVHVPLRAPCDCLAPERAALLVHELAHVWQHQRHGTRYLSESLLAQWFGAGYNVASGLAGGRSFAALNFEQQAELLERAWASGWFDLAARAAADGGAEPRLLLRLDDPRRDDGFAVEVAASAEAAAPRLAAGWLDATDLLHEGLAEVRRPIGRHRHDEAPGR